MALTALAALALQTATGAHAPDPPPPIRELRSPAHANLASYFSQDDYPVGARFNQEEGIVGVVVFVDALGGVAGCAVVASSNSSSLDEESCRIIRRRAHFTPAIDPSGRPVADFVAARIRWQAATASGSPDVPDRNTGPVDVTIVSGPVSRGLAPPYIRARPLGPLSALVTYRDYPPDAPRGVNRGLTSFRLTIGPDGNVDDCVISVSSGAAALDAAACRLMRERARFSPARIQAGNAISDDHWGRIDWGNRERPPVLPPPFARQR